MTLVLGASCRDALLVMSDREETTPGGATKSVPKVYDIHPPGGEWWMVIGTAGRASIADLAVRNIARRLFKIQVYFR